MPILEQKLFRQNQQTKDGTNLSITSFYIYIIANDIQPRELLMSEVELLPTFSKKVWTVRSNSGNLMPAINQTICTAHTQN